MFGSHLFFYQMPLNVPSFQAIRLSGDLYLSLKVNEAGAIYDVGNKRGRNSHNGPNPIISQWCFDE